MKLFSHFILAAFLCTVMAGCQFKLLEIPKKSHEVNVSTDEPIRKEPCPAIVKFDDNLLISPQWSQGDTKDYQFFKYRKEQREDGSIVEGESVTDIKVSVTHMDESGYRIEWSHGTTEILGVPESSPESINTILETIEGLHLAYSIDPYGGYIGLDDIDTLVAFAEGMLREIAKSIEAESGREGVVAEYEIFLQQLTSDPRLFEAIFSRNAQGFHAVYGVPFNQEVLLSFEDALPNPLGGRPISSEVEIQLERYNLAMDCMRVSIRNRADPKVARESMIEALTIQAERMGTPPPEDADLPEELVFQDRMYFDIELSTGWPIEYQIERYIQFGDAMRIDRQIMVQVP